MKVINGDFGKKDEERTVAEQIQSAVDELGIGQEKQAAFFVAIETDTGLHTAANERVGDSLLTLELVKHSLLKAYIETKEGA